jgi:glutathione synthase/RimK-type ligase-like ATP-grasp enzyme
MTKFFRPNVRSRHDTHSILRKLLPLMPFRSIVRFGSPTVLGDEVSQGGNRIELNTVEAVRNSSDKLRMKRKFTEHNVPTAAWCELSQWNNQFEFPVVVKHRFGSRGEGNYLIKSAEDLARWRNGKTENNYIIEKYHAYNREYRLHVTKDGYSYACRKVLRANTPENQRWYRNDQNSNWLVESNAAFDKPVNWDAIITAAVNAMKAVGLDFCAVDLRVQSAEDKKGRPRTAPEFFILETNSAPSFGDITTLRYLEEIPKLLMKKYHASKEEAATDW